MTRNDTGTLLGGSPGLQPPETRAPARRRARLVWIIVVLLLIAGLVYVLWPNPEDGDAAQHGRHGGNNGPMPVGVATAQKGDLQVTLSALGTVTPLATVTVHTQINGLLMQLGFQEGQMVKQGDFLAQIDPRPYEAQLMQYEGQLAKDQAALADAELDMRRYQTLVAQDSIASQTLDTQIATVHQDEGTVKTDQAQVNTARLNLVYCHIVAPVSGRVGLRQVDLGNYVQTSDANGIVVLTQLQPISVIFVLPEDDIDQIVNSMRGGAKPEVTAFDRTGNTKLATGALETIDNQIDTTTGTVKLRALFDNKDSLLFPNQFVNASLLVNTLHDATIIPVAAIQRGAPGTFVYLVKPDDTVTVQMVKLGPAQGETVAILDGLKPGDKVVIDGTDKLKEGAKVSVPQENGKDGTAPASGDKTGDATNSTASGHRHGHHQHDQNNSQ